MNNEKRWEDIFEKALEGNKVNEVNSFEEAMRLNSLIEIADQSRTLPHTNFPEQRRLILAASLKQQLQNSVAIQIAKAAPIAPVVAPKIQAKPLQRTLEPRQRMGWQLFLGFQQAFVVVFLFIAVGVVVYAATRPETPMLPTTIPAAATRPSEEATPTPPPVATATLEIATVTTLVIPAPVATPEPTAEPSPTSQPTPSPTTAASTATATKTTAPVVVRTTPKPAPTATKKPEPTSSPTPVRTTEVEATSIPTATATNTVPATPVPPTQPPSSTPTVKPSPSSTPTEDEKEPEPTPGHR